MNQKTTTHKAIFSVQSDYRMRDSVNNLQNQTGKSADSNSIQTDDIWQSKPIQN